MGLQFPNVIHATVGVRPELSSFMINRAGVKQVYKETTGQWRLELDQPVSDAEMTAYFCIRSKVPGVTFALESITETMKRVYSWGGANGSGVIEGVDVGFDVLIIRMPIGVH